MISQNSELVAKSKFLTCKCLYLLSSDSNKDQKDTQFTINRIQLYLKWSLILLLFVCDPY